MAHVCNERRRLRLTAAGKLVLEEGASAAVDLRLLLRRKNRCTPCRHELRTIKMPAATGPKHPRLSCPIYIVYWHSRALESPPPCPRSPRPGIDLRPLGAHCVPLASAAHHTYTTH
jgi:hypothetical protein